MTYSRRRIAVVAAVALVLVTTAAVAGRLAATSPEASPIAKLALGGMEPQFNSPGGVANGGTGGESAELMASMQQYDSARIAPGTIVAPGAYSAAFSSRHGRQGRRRLRRRRRRRRVALDVRPDRALWYATGEANTGGTWYVGSGVYRLTDTVHGKFTPADRVGGTELESTTIFHVRVAGTTAYAATIRGLWSHSVSGPNSERWKLLFAPNPDYLPGGKYADVQNAADKNYVNDVAIDPKNARHIVVAAGWRAGAAYNGFYESNDGGATWAKINPGGAINPKDIGYANFAYSSDGSKLYVINESVTLYNQLNGVNAANTILDGIYVSNNGNPAGPWTKIADSQKLAANGSPLKQAIGGKGYGPGAQAWYNQFLIVDPADAKHVYAGLEEVYETKNAGANWNTAGPYWNFYFSCWNVDTLYPPNGESGRNGCPLTRHADQHSVAIGTVGGKSYVYVGNDGGVYRRPVDGH